MVERLRHDAAVCAHLAARAARVAKRVKVRADEAKRRATELLKLPIYPFGPRQPPQSNRECK
jgi:hypothetical protein